MATSITGLQNEPNLTVFRKFEIRRRQGSTYETNWLDVSSYVTQWPQVENAEDIVEPFKFRVGTAYLKMRNDEKQFSAQTFGGSLFSGWSTRYKTLCKISSGLQDEDGVQYPSTTTNFIGLISDNVNDGELETQIQVNSVVQALTEFNSANIASSIVNTALTSAQIIGYMRDYTISAQSYLQTFISSSAWLLTSTGRTYTIPTTTELDNLNGFDLISELANVENFVFYVDNQSNLVFSPRSTDSVVSYTFNGSGNKNINISSIDDYNEGISRIYNRVSFALASGTVSTQETFTVGDASSSWLYGQREYALSSKWANTATAGSVCSSILNSFVNPKPEIVITTKYISQLNIGNRVTVKHFGQPSGTDAKWDIAIWDQDEWSDEKGGIYINQDFYITAINLDLQQPKTQFYLRGV